VGSGPIVGCENGPGTSSAEGDPASKLIPLCSYSANVGISDARHNLFWSEGASYQGPPAHAHEALRVEWIPLK
jgi:hypothetical protein